VSAPILDVKNLRVSFDGVEILTGLTLQLDHGELRFLIGPNGAGKTTFLDVVTGKVRPTGGSVIFDGRVDVRRQSIDGLARIGIGRKFQAPSIFASLTVRENVAVAANGRRSAFALLGGTSARTAGLVDEVLETVGLIEHANLRAGILAHGEQQWLEIGLLLAQQPKLLLLDEPVAGMTRAERDRTGELLKTIARQHSVLIVEHDMHFVRQFSAKVTVLHAGRVLTEGPMSEVQNDERVIEVYLGKSARRGNGVEPSLEQGKIETVAPREVDNAEYRAPDGWLRRWDSFG